jgi:hypothetical protein
MHFLNNSTVAALVAVVIGTFVAARVYRKQKDIDRRYAAEDQLLESVLVLKEHCKAVNQYIDRLVNTLNVITEEGDSDALSTFMQESLPKEVDEAGRVLMYVIPDDIAKIESSKFFYFNEDVNIKDAVQAVFDTFKKWHDSTQNYLTGKTGTFDSHKRVADVPELSLTELDQKIKELGVLFSKRP